LKNDRPCDCLAGQTFCPLYPPFYLPSVMAIPDSGPSHIHLTFGFRLEMFTSTFQWTRLMDPLPVSFFWSNPSFSRGSLFPSRRFFGGAPSALQVFIRECTLGSLSTTRFFETCPDRCVCWMGLLSNSRIVALPLFPNGVPDSYDPKKINPFRFFKTFRFVISLFPGCYLSWFILVERRILSSF